VRHILVVGSSTERTDGLIPQHALCDDNTSFTVSDNTYFTLLVG